MKANRNFLIGGIVIIVCLVTAFVLGKKGVFESKDVCSRAQVAKLVVLSLMSQDNVEETTIEKGYKDLKQDTWYAKYMSAAIQADLFELNQQEGYCYPEKLFTYREVKRLLLQLGIADANLSFSLKSDDPVRREDINEIMNLYIDQNENAKMKRKKVFVLDVDSKKQLMITNCGTFHIAGVSLKKKKNKAIIIYAQEGICAGYVGENKGSMTLRNVWCKSAKADNTNIFINGYTVVFDNNTSFKSKNQIVDVTLKNQKVVNINSKKETILDTVLAVQDENIEFKKYGSVATLKEFPIYEIGKNVKMQDKNHIVIGTTDTTFVMRNGKIEAAYITKKDLTNRIRVLINTTDYTSLFHSQVVVTCNQDYVVNCKGEKKKYKAGKEYKVNHDRNDMSERICIEPVKKDACLTVKSIKRSYGTPAYHGKLEIVSQKEGLLVINDVPIEEYLYSVVPSEMPVSYGEEALKVQAVCARSYACANILNSNFSKYGAHLDDSTQSQVYNNVQETQESMKAVDATYQQVLFYGTQLANTYFFSTSCGYTGNVSDVWLTNNTTPEYLTGKLQAKKEKKLHLDEEDIFSDFIDHPEQYNCFEKNVGWFRWTVTQTKEQLEATINSHLQTVRSNIRVKNKEGKYVGKDIATIGKLKNIKVVSRSDSGVIKCLQVTGSQANIRVYSEYAIRVLLGNQDIAITTKDGSRTQLALLPSGYFYVAVTKDDEGKNGMYSFNGGGLGHGVGLSQNGVKEMTELGYQWQQILSHYYPGTKLKSYTTTIKKQSSTSIKD